MCQFHFAALSLCVVWLYTTLFYLPACFWWSALDPRTEITWTQKDPLNGPPIKCSAHINSGALSLYISQATLCSDSLYRPSLLLSSYFVFKKDHIIDSTEDSMITAVFHGPLWAWPKKAPYPSCGFALAFPSLICLTCVLLTFPSCVLKSVCLPLWLPVCYFQYVPLLGFLTVIFCFSCWTLPAFDLQISCQPLYGFACPCLD